MDQKKVILAIALSVVLFIVIQFFMGPETTEKQQASSSEKLPETQAIEVATGSGDTVAQPASTETPAIETVADAPVKRDFRNVTVETNLFEVTLSEKGAVVERLALKNYKQTKDKNSPMQELVTPAKNPNGTILTSTWATAGIDHIQAYETTAPEKVMAEKEKQAVAGAFGGLGVNGGQVNSV